MSMQVKAYLKQAYRLNELIQSDQQELEDLRLLASSVPGIDYSKDKVQSSPSGDAGFTNIVMRIVELEAAINKDIDRLLALKLEIRETINAVQDNEERLLLKYRYLNFMSWDDICSMMCISVRTAHRIHSSAIANVKIPAKIES